MKELSIEEKAKRYDEAYKVAKNIHIFSSDLAEIKRMEEIFPELKEESEDERIMEKICKLLWDNAPYEEAQEYIAWLEQKPIDKSEPTDYNSIDPYFCKPIDKVEPKFKVEKDKWYVCTSQYCNCIEGRNYKASLDGRIIDDFGTEYDMHDDAYRWFRPWTIQDAKDGDVLAAIECYVIFKKIDGLNIKCYCTYHYMGFNSSFHINTLQNKTAFHPATEEQRDFLFQKMKKVGYEWDAEKKELKKIEQKPAWSEDSSKELSLSLQIQAYLNTASDELYAKGKPLYSERRLEDIHKCMLMWQKLHNAYFYQKSAWSEEDEIALDDALWCCKQAASIAKDENDMGTTWYAERWLKSLKDRVQSQPKQDWSEEDEERLSDAIFFVREYQIPTRDKRLLNAAKETEDWLRTLRPQNLEAE